MRGRADDKRNCFIQIIDPLLGSSKTRPAVAPTDCQVPWPVAMRSAIYGATFSESAAILYAAIPE
jgi:hypothetical protein